MNEKQFVGEWLNFEYFIDSEDENMKKTWQEVEEHVQQGNIPMFKHGARNFWRQVCDTSRRYPGLNMKVCKIHVDDSAIYFEFINNQGQSLGLYAYEVDSIVEKGLEGKNNYLFVSKEAKDDYPFKYILAMDPLPEKKAAFNGGILRHIHFQFATTKDELIDDTNHLVHPMEYPTLCEADSTDLERYNIVRALHRLDLKKKV